MLLKGMVLAAGLGTRLRPLTAVYPKPLVPFAGTTPLALALWRLKGVGIDDVAVNSHHLAAAIAACLATNPWQQRLRHAHEPELLGTGGVYNPLRSWLGEDSLLVLNGDIVSTIVLERLIDCHLRGGFVATMALLPDVIPGESAVYHAAGRVCAIGKDLQAVTLPEGVQAANFACAQILSPAFLRLLPQSGCFDIVSRGYQQALAQGLPIGAFVHEGLWHDLRDPRYLWAALQDVIRTPANQEATGLIACRAQAGLRPAATAWGPGIVLDDSSTIGSGVQFSAPVVVEPGCHIATGAKIANALLLPGTQVGARDYIHNMILGPSLRLPLAPA